MGATRRTQDSRPAAAAAAARRSGLEEDKRTALVPKGEGG